MPLKVRRYVANIFAAVARCLGASEAYLLRDLPLSWLSRYTVFHPSNLGIAVCQRLVSFRILLGWKTSRPYFPFGPKSTRHG